MSDVPAGSADPGSDDADPDALDEVVPVVPTWHGVPHLTSRDHDLLFPSRDELLDTLGHALQAAGIGFYTIFEKASGRPRVVFRWTHPSQTEAMHRDAVTARYPIGRDGLERADIEFGWLSEDGDVSPQMAILLQVVVDMLELNLRRVRSPLAPRSAEEHMVTEAAAGAAALARDSRPQLTTHST